MKGASSVFLVLLFAFINLGTVSSEGSINLSGTVENGTKDVTLDEAQLSIKLNVLEGIVSIDERVVVTEPGGAVAATALFENKLDFKNKNVIIMISGGNIDNSFFSSLIDK